MERKQVLQYSPVIMVMVCLFEMTFCGSQPTTDLRVDPELLQRLNKARYVVPASGHALRVVVELREKKKGTFNTYPHQRKLAIVV